MNNALTILTSANLLGIHHFKTLQHRPIVTAHPDEDISAQLFWIGASAPHEAMNLKN